MNEGDREGNNRKRQNYKKDDRMMEAIKQWEQQHNQVLPVGQPWLTKEQITKSKGISLSSFLKYTHQDPSKRRKLGTKRGRKQSFRKTTSKSLLIMQSLFLKQMMG